MSLHETPMIRKYWKQVGGTLIEEFPVVRGSKQNGRRSVDAIILLHEENKICNWKQVDINGKYVICVQAKHNRLGMYLMGQTFFSQQLIRKYFKPKSVISVALCKKDDVVLRPLLEQYSNCKVVIID